MPKIINYLYADFETTPIEIPDGYNNYHEVLTKNVPHKKSEVVSWVITKKQDDKDIQKNIKDVEYGVFNDIEKECINFYGNNIYTFLLFITQLKNDTWIYFNNLKGFDGHFIIPALDNLGFKIVVPYNLENIELSDSDKMMYLKLKEDRKIMLKSLLLKKEITRKAYENYGNEWLEKYIEKNWNTLVFGEYSLLTNENSQIYEIKIATNNFKVSKSKFQNHIISIRDNLLLFPSSIKKMGINIAKHYINNGMKKEYAEKMFHKKTLNYSNIKEYETLEELTNDKEHLEYLFEDAFILMKYHDMMSNYFPRKHWKLTIASTSYSEWIRVFGDKILDSFIDKGIVKEITLERGANGYLYKNKSYLDYKLKKILINELFPTNWLDSPYNSYMSNHESIYDSYNGGITTLNEVYRGRYLENLTYLDLNSSYSSSMIKNVYAPYGVGYKGNKKESKYKIYKINIKQDIYNEKGLPFLFDINLGDRQYLKHLYKGCEIVLNTYQYERFLKYYTSDKSKFKIEVLWSFDTINMKYIFEDYINKWYTIKEQASINGDELLKSIAKLFLNSLYGKFGTKSKRKSKIWNQFSCSWEKSTEYIESKFYLPLADAITSLSRMELVDGVGNNYDSFVYSDTDSMIIKDFDIKNFSYLNIDKSLIGAWDIEGVFNGVFRRPKQYFLKDINYEKNNKIKIAFAGINFDKTYLPDDEEEIVDDNIKIFSKLTYKKFLCGDNDNGTIIKNQTKPERVLGYGIVIDTIEKRIKPIWEYKPLKEQIYITKEDYYNNWKKEKIPW